MKSSDARKRSEVYKEGGKVKTEDVYSYNEKGMLLNGKFVMNKPMAGSQSRETYDKDVADYNRKDSLKKWKKATKTATPITKKKK